MSQRYAFTTVDRILAKHHRELRGLDIHEGDALEWIGDALGFMQMPNVSEEAVAFFEVKDHHAELPNHLHFITQVAKYAGSSQQVTPAAVVYDGATESTPADTGEPQIGVCLDENGNLLEGTKYAYYRPYFDLQYEYLDWAYSRVRQQAFTPVRLADHTFFNSIVAREEDDRIASAYQSCNDEYTVVGNVCRKLRFSFKEGYVAVAFTRQAMDKDTGYPLIPDDQNCIEAINYFLTWKFMQRSFFLGREGSPNKVDYAEKRWGKYLTQFKNHAFGPFGIDDFEDLKDQGNYMVPRRKLYDNYFGDLSRRESRSFLNPQSNQRRQ